MREHADPVPQVRRVDLEAPWAWLAAGLHDMRRAPAISLTYGAIFCAISLALSLGLFFTGTEYLLPPLAAGFMLVGPLLAVGLYETSRRLESGEPLHWRKVLLVSTRAPAQLAFIGIFLTTILLVWMRAATILFALFIGTLAFPPLSEIVTLLLFTFEGLALLVVGTGVGAVLAAAVFAVSVVSIPLLMVRDIDAVTAAMVSLRAVYLNWRVMLIWGWLIAMLTVCGLVTFYAGLIVTFPLVGHATWHAYRAMTLET